MLRINMLGVAMLVVGGIAAVIALILKVPDAYGMIVIGSAIALADLIWRARSFGAHGWLTDRTHGGSLSVLPMWGVGLFLIVVNSIKLLFPNLGL